MKRWLRRAALLGAALLGAAIALDQAFPPDLSRARQVGTEVLDRSGRPISLWPAPGGVWRLAGRADDIPDHTLRLLLAVEDQRFRSHPGVDPLALARAVAQWVRAGRIVSGGSTITMQVARLLEPRPRTLASKLIEVFRAVQLEARLTKSEILGLWLTLAPYGGNLEGLRAGALAWVGRPPANLDAAESALLVALPRSPERLRPDRHPERARAVRDRVIAVGERAGVFSQAEAASARAAPLPERRVALPRAAPQATRALAQQAPGGRIPSTLDGPLQRALEALAAELRRDLPDRASLAIVVADGFSREIRALSAGEWLAEGRAGALDLTRAVRSPGSALKPFLYAMAFAEGHASPDRPVLDLPERFGPYAPENFDRGFAGQVTAAQALRMSLNLPAVALLERVGPLRFAAMLKEAGAHPRIPGNGDPALPLALGGAGFTLREVTGLYAALVEPGVAGPLRLTGAALPARLVLPPHGARMAAASITQPFPTGGPAGIAWKTGTSWGGRDAWAFGADARHVAGVWIGRPDGTAMPGATGRVLALPALARVFSLLPANPRAMPVPRLARAGAPAEPADRLRLLFPPPGAVLAEAAPVTLRAMGGRRPLNFLVDGARIESEPARREAGWRPPGPGLYRVTVLDAEGGSATAEVRVR